MRWERTHRLLACAIVVVVSLGGATSVGAASPRRAGAIQVSAPLAHALSPALRGRPLARVTSGVKVRDLKRYPTPPRSTRKDPVIQSSTPLTASPAPGTSRNFEGIRNDNIIPPDTNGAVGATQYVQWVNIAFAVFDKSTGTLLFGPTAGNTLWAAFQSNPNPGPQACANRNDGDPTAQYDKAANRWVMTQFAIPNSPGNGPDYQCVAVSTTADATGTYNIYVYQLPSFNDYPKLGIWRDGYYISFNMFGGSGFQGPRACVMDRSGMLNGVTSPAMQCAQLPNIYRPLLPADLDGTTLPAAGEPGFFMNFGTNSLNLWKFHVDWSNVAFSTFTGPTNIPVAAFTAACGGGGTCIPQVGTTTQLDSLADRLMYRLAYRNFPGSPGHESLVVNHSVTASTITGVRWYEVRNPSGAPTVFQQGTYAPADGNHRWMGSIAMDHMGDMAMGYSVSGSLIHPEIRYTGRLSTDPLNLMGTAEATLMAGTGSQTTYLGNPITRWGDYSSMSVDPVDDCTFWYTNEYYTVDGFDWHTRIGSFKFPRCGSWTSTGPSTTDWLFGSSCSNSGAATQRCFAVGSVPVSSGPTVGHIYRSGGLPNSMASTGDSITRAFDIDGAHFLQDDPAESWSTGTDCASVNSQYCRILSANIGISGNVHNDAKTGARMADLDGQLVTAAAQNVQYATVEMGANDVCASSIGAMTPTATVQAQAQTALHDFFAADPGAHVSMYSIPDIYQLYLDGIGNPSARSTWALFSICQSMLAPTNTAAQRQQVVAQEQADNTALQTVCSQFANCKWDDLAVYYFKFPASDVSTVDYFHPNFAGQNDAARVSWGAGYFPPSVGSSWTEPPTSTPANPAIANGLNAVSCSPSLGSSTCYVVGGSGLIGKTTNNGGTWSWANPRGTGHDLYGVDCGDDTNCWAVGDTGNLWRTTNGTTWSSFAVPLSPNPAPVTDPFFGVSCTSKSTCEAVGSNGLAVHIASADTVPLITHEFGPTTTSLNAVSCPGGTTVDCIAASDGPVGAREHSSAGVWSSSGSPTAALFGAGCQMYPSADAAAVGCSAAGPGGNIFTTSDGGTTWPPDASPTTLELDGVDCSQSVTFCLAVGQNGTILKR